MGEEQNKDNNNRNKNRKSEQIHLHWEDLKQAQLENYRINLTGST